MVRSTGFAVTETETLVRDGRELVKVQFTYSPSSWDGNVPRDGWVVLDPQLRWLVVEAKTKGEWGGGREKGTLEIINKYNRNQAGTPLLERQEIVIRVPEDGANVDDLWTHEYEEFVGAECDPEHYTLSAFGLPEPQLDSGTKASRGRLFFIIGNILVIAAIGLLLWFARVKHKKT